MNKNAIRFSRGTVDYIYNACSEVFEIEDENVAELMLVIENGSLNDNQIDIVLGLIENARLVHTYFPDQSYDSIIKELESVIG